MVLELNIEQLQKKKSAINNLLEKQKRKLSSRFESDLEKQFWIDREQRLIKMIVRAYIPAIFIFLLFEFISYPINYLTTEPEFRNHDIRLTLISYSVGWFALFSIIFMAKRPQWNHYYRYVVFTVIFLGLSIVQTVLLSTQSLAMTWRGTLIITFAIMFAYLCSGLRPRMTFYANIIASLVTIIILNINQIVHPVWVITNTLILSNLVGLALSTLAISTERIRFLQSIIIEYDKQIYALLNQHLMSLSHQDTLTLLSNRRGFEKVLQSCIDDTFESGSALAVLFIDVDFFKLYNDSYGHDCGDKALVRVSQTLLRQISDQDIAIRYGGEEFVVILKNTNEAQAKQICQKILDDIYEQKIEHKRSTTSEYLSLSIGFTLYKGNHYLEYNALLKLADQALYQAKHDGRNMVKFLDSNY